MKPRLSIVLAVDAGPQRLPLVLAALREQLRKDVEVLVCFPKDRPELRAGCCEAAWATPVECPAGSLTPHLWRDGILRARAARVALTIVHCCPQRGWVDALLDADLETHAAVAGAIDNDPASDALGWAIYLLRYLPYSTPMTARQTQDLPGDNVLYDRTLLLVHAEHFQDGFWEPAIHARLAAEGNHLRLDPLLVTRHVNGYGTLEFARQRHAHGRRYGRDRARATLGWRGWLYALGSASAPLLLALKVLARTLRRPEARDHVVKALPYLCIFVVAWGTGEFGGALGTRFERRR